MLTWNHDVSVRAPVDRELSTKTLSSEHPHILVANLAANDPIRDEIGKFGPKGASFTSLFTLLCDNPTTIVVIPMVRLSPTAVILELL